MHYHVCVENCYEDFYNDCIPSVYFDTFEAAKDYANKHTFPTFDVLGEIRWYFPSCQANGELLEPDKDDVLECYQIINIIPSENENEIIDECYSNDRRSIYSLTR